MYSDFFIIYFLICCAINFLLLFMLTDFDTPTDEGNNKEIKENNPPKTSARTNGTIIHNPSVPNTHILPMVKSKGIVHSLTLITLAKAKLPKVKKYTVDKKAVSLFLIMNII